MHMRTTPAHRLSCKPIAPDHEFAPATPAPVQVSDEQLERSMRNQFKRMQDSGIDRLLFSPQASAMGHHFGSELVSRYWTEACNDLIAHRPPLSGQSLASVPAPPVAGGQP